MKIHSISSVIAIPLFIAFGYCVHNIYDDSYSGETWFIIIPIILLAILYTSQHLLNNWWLRKFTPDLDEKIKVWLQNYLPYYNAYNDEEKANFDRRLVLYVETREFKTIGMYEGQTDLTEVPFDLKNILASQGIRLCLGLDDYLIKDMDRVYLYKHPFPSPRYKFLHTAECDIEDGVYIFSIETALSGITNPMNHYNIVLHTYAEAFVQLFTNIHFPVTSANDWNRIILINGISKDKIYTTLGFEEVGVLPVHIVCFFEFPDQYEKLYGENFAQFCKIFNQNPLR